MYGTYRRLSTPNFWRLHYLNVYDKVKLIPADVQDSRSISEAVRKSNPDEIYHLSAQSFVGASFDQPLQTSDVTGFGVARILDELKKFNAKIRFYQASSSEMYGNEKSPIKNELTPFQPASPYAIAKLYAHWTVAMHRKAYGIHASNGILFNHESPLRGLEFVTRKISNGVAKISLGLAKDLKLGNLSAKRDWGYAPEYVEGMWRMLQQKKPDDYVLATNESHSIKEFLELAFQYGGLGDWRPYVEIDPYYFRPAEVEILVGDSRKAKEKLNWEPKIKLPDLVKIMVDSDFREAGLEVPGEGDKILKERFPNRWWTKD